MDTPLNFAAVNGHLEVCRYLLENEAGINYCGNDEQKPLILAAANGHLEVCRYLLEKGADINGTNRSGGKALHCAASHGYLDIVRLVLDSGDDANTPDKFGFTLLHWSILRCHVETTMKFLDHGVSRTSRDICGRTPLDCLFIHESDQFYSRFPSLKDFQSTSQSDRERRGQENVQRIAGEIEQAESDEEVLWAQLECCLIQLNDIALATRCILQVELYGFDEKRSMLPRTCCWCSGRVSDIIFISKSCPHTYFSPDCMVKHKESPVRYCVGHEYFQVRMINPDGGEEDVVAEHASAMKELLKDIRSKYGPDDTMDKSSDSEGL